VGLPRLGVGDVGISEPGAAVSEESASTGSLEAVAQPTTILSTLDLTVSIAKDEYAEHLSSLQARLNLLEFSGHLDMQWSGKEYKPFRE